MVDRFRNWILLAAGVLAGSGGYLIHDVVRDRAHPASLVAVTGTGCCIVAVLLLFQLFLHGRDPREPKEE